MNKKKRLHILTFFILHFSFFIISCPNPLVLQVLDPRTITFETDGGSRVESQIVYRGYPVKRPVDPVKEGSIFDGWYTDKDKPFVNKWNFDTVPTQDITLYAKWNLIGGSSVTIINDVAITVTGPLKGEEPVTTAPADGDGYTCGAVMWDPEHDLFQGSTIYTVSVTLTAHEGYAFALELSAAMINGNDAEVVYNTDGTVTLSYKFAETSDKKVEGISVTTQPTQLFYTHGDTLDLTGLAVTLTYEGDMAETEDVALDDFESKNISASPAHGTVLSRSTHHGDVVTVSIGSHPANTNTLTVNAKPINAEDITVEQIDEHIYNGSAHEPPITIKDGSTILVLGTDYKVSYSNNTDAGAATVTISGINNYTGSRDEHFTILKADGAPVPAPTDEEIGADSVTLKAVTPPETEQEVEYAHSTTSTAPESGWQYSTTFSGLTANTIYYFFARSAANGNYNAGAASAGTPITTQGYDHVHQLGNWIVTAPATETTDGVETGTCPVCNDTGTRFSGEYATGTAGLDFTLISINGGTNNAYRVSRGTATGDIVIPAYHREDAESDYLPVTTIGTAQNTSSNNAFGGTSPTNLNTTVTSITFAAGSQLTTISNFAFLYCANLKSITIPASVASIGPNAFDTCASLTTVTIPANSNLTLIGDSAFLYCASLTGITIPASVTSIGLQAFGHCTSLASITIPSSVTAIGQSTFIYCTSLASITIPSSVTAIGNSAFSGCTNIKSVTFAAGSQLKTISHAAFLGCTSLTGITIPASVTEIDDWAFQNCSSLASVIIPASVTSIGATAFADCTSLASVTIGAGVATIGDNAFQDCTSLKNITIDNDVYPTISGGNNWGAIFPADDLSVTFRKNVGEWAFWGCTRLKSVTIAAGVTSIGQQAFINCTSLTSVTIAEGVTSIDVQAFDSCTSLTNITIPASVTFIGDHAFNYWVILQTINIRGHAGSQSADNAWGTNWRIQCNATIKYWNGSSYQ